MSYHIKKNANYEARIYLGSCLGYNGPQFSFEELRAVIGEFQKSGIDTCNPVRITPTTYVWADYQEAGWEIAVINYPRYPKSHIVLHDFAYNLAALLLEKFQQQRISIVLPDEIVMLEADDAEAKN